MRAGCGRRAINAFKLPVPYYHHSQYSGRSPGAHSPSIHEGSNPDRSVYIRFAGHARHTTGPEAEVGATMLLMTEYELSPIHRYHELRELLR